MVAEESKKIVTSLEKVNLGKKEREKIRNHGGNIVNGKKRQWIEEGENREIKKLRYKIQGNYDRKNIPKYMTKKLKST